MEDFSLPSFSLGLDIDITDLSTEEEEEEDKAVRPLHKQRAYSIQQSEEIGVQENLEEAQEEEPPLRVLKRLRRGPRTPSFVVSGASCSDFDGGDLTIESCDDIEDFSSPEKDVKHSAGHRFLFN